MIPVIDLSQYSLSVSVDDVPTHTLKNLADEICSAMKNVGFVYIINHGIPEEKVIKTSKIDQGARPKILIFEIIFINKNFSIFVFDYF
jgi:isopenicillin N synthase-like dioxygenase